MKDDLISRQAAIDAITQYLGRIKRDFKQWEGTARIILDHVPSAQPGWIPCSTALPKKNGQYIITVKYEHVDGYEDIYSEHGEWVDGHWDSGFGYYHCGRVEKVLAWMPLPESWKGGRK